MKLIHPEIQTVFQFGTGYFPALVIENPAFFLPFH